MTVPMKSATVLTIVVLQCVGREVAGATIVPAFWSERIARSLSSGPVPKQTSSKGSSLTVSTHRQACRHVDTAAAAPGGLSPAHTSRSSRRWSSSRRARYRQRLAAPRNGHGANHHHLPTRHPAQARPLLISARGPSFPWGGYAEQTSPLW